MLEKETLSVDGKIFTLDYGYDALGTLSSLAYPDGKGAVNFAPNGFGQATQAIRVDGSDSTVFVKGGNDKASYHPNGTINTFTYGNNLVHKTTLNSRQLPQLIHDYLGSTSKVKLGYSYDNNNNITSIINGVDSNFSLSALTYDGLDRLKSTTGNSAGIGSSALSYDALGNIRSYSNTSVLNPSNLTYGYNSSFRLSSVSGTGSEGYNFSQSGSYDNRGNVTHNGKRSFSYNLANQMTASGANRYLYDGYNRRIKTTDSKGTGYSMYSQQGRLLYRETVKGGISYIYLGDKLVAKTGAGVVTKSDDAGYNSVMNFKPFGETIEAANDEVGYTGHKFDTDLGLSYMQARYYDPAIGKFNQPDPVDVLGHLARGSIVHGFNPYTYANNNPYKYIDPTGKIPALLLFAPEIVALGKATLFVGSAGVAGYAGSEAINTYNESSKDEPVKDKKRKYTKKDRKKMYETADGKCEYCGDDITMDPGTGKSMEGDHIIPWVDGGQTDENNGAATCRDCNRSKGKKRLGEKGDQFPPKDPNDRIKDKMLKE
ncbi:HNH endonuclease [Thalassomonas viridans]|uniref:HNH endonuclease n=1 Tax=Thalassomonas viridans TaxID=137584 RepID=A0AAE9Z2B1_9GAMM|nr:RHS repeat-associated core domain-containing protein [Thalassomonas viridans]WDE05511.1 HNH endonuclease [Thalassomonas viridans]